MANEKAKAQIENLCTSGKELQSGVAIGSEYSDISRLESRAKKGDSPVVGLGIAYDQKQRVGQFGIAALIWR